LSDVIIEREIAVLYFITRSHTVACRINTAVADKRFNNCMMFPVFLNANEVPASWIKSIKNIREGEELFWDYGYSERKCSRYTNLR
jgi:hypothetical protein